MSSFFDDIQSKAKALVQSQMSNVGDFLKQQVLGGPQLVKVGQNPGGNLSAAQLNAGMMPQPVQASVGPASFIEQYGMYMGIGAVALIGIIILAKR